MPRLQGLVCVNGWYWFFHNHIIEKHHTQYSSKEMV